MLIDIGLVEAILKHGKKGANGKHPYKYIFKFKQYYGINIFSKEICSIIAGHITTTSKLNLKIIKK